MLCFNPARFSEKRTKDTDNLKGVEEAIAEWNLRLADPRNRRTDASALAAAHKRIVRVGLGAVLSPRLEKQEALRRIVLERDGTAWARRRQVDDLAVLVGHPELPGTPEDLVALYFAKDAVEKDFQTIKSAIELRPVHHRTDARLRAHVTICMLALLMQRVLSERLKRTASKTSAATALATLARAHLNRVVSGKNQFHTLTRLDGAQESLLAAIAMEELARDDWIATNISPRWRCTYGPSRSRRWSETAPSAWSTWGPPGVGTWFEYRTKAGDVAARGGGLVRVPDRSRGRGRQGWGLGPLGGRGARVPGEGTRVGTQGARAPGERARAPGEARARRARASAPSVEQPLRSLTTDDMLTGTSPTCIETMLGREPRPVEQSRRRQAPAPRGSRADTRWLTGERGSPDPLARICPPFHDCWPICLDSFGEPFGVRSVPRFQVGPPRCATCPPCVDRRAFRAAGLERASFSLLRVPGR